MLGIGGKERNCMKRKIKYSNEPSDVDLDAARVIKDFLPPPEQLVFKEKTIKVTLDKDGGVKGNKLTLKGKDLVKKNSKEVDDNKPVPVDGYEPFS